jgi:hypothetical protein
VRRTRAEEKNGDGDGHGDDGTLHEDARRFFARDA